MATRMDAKINASEAKMDARLNMLTNRLDATIADLWCVVGQLSNAGSIVPFRRSTAAAGTDESWARCLCAHFTAVLRACGFCTASAPAQNLSSPFYRFTVVYTVFSCNFPALHAPCTLSCTFV